MAPEQTRAQLPGVVTGLSSGRTPEEALARVMDDVDAYPWSAVSHAYGPAEDLPGLLRVLAEGEPDAAGEAVSELYGSVLHQGTVYAASAAVAPFLARVAAAGRSRADLLTLLGGMAESEDEHGVEQGTVRAAVAAQLPLMLPALSAGEPEVRRAAAWAVAHTREARAVLPGLRERWEREPEAPVRGELLGAVSRLAPAEGAALAREALAPPGAPPGPPAGASTGPPHVLLAAVFACLDAGVPWDAAQHSALLSTLPADPLGSDSLDLDRTEPLHAVVEALLLRDTEEDRAAVAALLDTALRDGRAEVRAEALWAAEQACRLSRGTRERLLPSLLPLLSDADSARGVVSLLGGIGAAAATAVPALLALATVNADAADDGTDREGITGERIGGDTDLADRALGVVAVLSPEKAAPLLARDLGRRPWALDAAAGSRAPEGTRFPFDRRLLAAIRVRLTEPDLPSGEPWQLTRLLRDWGALAAPALPELCALLPRHPQAAEAIEAIHGAEAPAEPAVVDALRAAADSGPLVVARALYRWTGETPELLRRLGKELAGGPEAVARAAGAAGELGAVAAPLVPALRAAPSGADAAGTTSVLDADTAIAEALWRITRDASPAVPVLDSVFARAAGRYWFRRNALRAARAAALLGPAGRPLVPRLEALLADPQQAPVAVLALIAVAEPGSLDRRALAGAVLTSAEQGASAPEACDALEALGATALTPDHVRRLGALAERDLRVVRWGLEDQVVRADDALRARARAVLGALTGDLSRAVPPDGRGRRRPTPAPPG
ncbi:hypothetical protein [Streptomyces zaomyceticus]|uniref:hypothetical protein n=1 Tax=Streptomyces zaomyceticus TaxID=68286 RepID=UPI0016796D2C|nr:hypothetical protein [Streptomyces zaomyceticus]GHG18004.1 hypothetical protein GCM10018791_35950 [Streptomyces zaomyceticus]